MSDDAASRLYQAFVDQDPAAAITVIEQVKAAGVAQDQLFDTLFAPAMSVLGGAWAAGVIDEYEFTQAAVVAEQVTSFVAPPLTAPETGVAVIIGAMHRDHHAIVKNIIAAALKEAGHRVVDLGVDVRPADFLERVDETGARILLVCASMTSTAVAVSRVREMLEAAGRQDVVLLVSGGPFTADVSLAKEVGANGVVKSAESALRMIERVATERLSEGS